MFRITSCIVIFTALWSLTIADDPCRFQVAGKGVIDISSLANKNGKAAFPDETPSIASNWLFSYNPCKPFTEGDTCKNVAVCQVSRDKTLTFILATQDSAKWNAGAGPGTNPSIAYTYGEKQVSVELNCSEKTTAEFEAIGESPINFYIFRLTHKCACWDGCKSSGGGSSLPGGAIFIIILLVLAVVYFTGFAAFYRFRHQKSGVDLIAHRTFWVALPVYAKGGVTYIFRRVTGKGGGEYQAV